MRQKASENKAVVALFEKHGMANGVDGVDGTLRWWRREDDRPLVGLIVRAVEDLLQCEQDLRTQAAGIQRDLTAMLSMLDEGYNLNQAGVLQRGGPQLDMLCARRQYLAEHLNALLWTLKESGKENAR